MELFQGQIRMEELLHKIPLSLMRALVDERVEMLKKRAEEQKDSVAVPNQNHGG
jgi:hypothetical protein